MKASDLTILLLCIGFGIALVSAAGLGGEQMNDSFWGKMVDASVNFEILGNKVSVPIGYVATGVLIVVIISCAVASFLAPKGLQGAGLVIYALTSAMIFTIMSLFFFDIPYVGIYVGSFFLIFAMITLLLDVSEKMGTG